MDSVRILKTEMSVTNIDNVVENLIFKNKISVAICNSNTLVRCYKDGELNKIICLLIFDVQMDCSKASKIFYKNNQMRVDGYKLFLQTIERGLDNNVSHYFFGNSEEIVLKMIEKLKAKYADINIKGFTCPPNLTFEELSDEKFVHDINTKNPDILWVSLGFPKQEKFINSIRKNNSINTNMVGVGAVFEWVAGTKIKAPEWLANIGLEWLIRLIQEPKRLFRRYLVDNFLFIIYFIKQYIRN